MLPCLRRCLAALSVSLICAAAAAPPAALAGTWADTGTPPAPNDPNYQPVETGYPASCTARSVADEQLHFYGFLPKCGEPPFGHATDPENASGMSISTAWQDFGSLATGRPDVVIAYIEGGINWHNGDAAELADKVYLNWRELPVPCRNPCGPPVYGKSVSDYDANHDGVFNAADYAGDPRVTDSNGNGIIDAEDVIVAFTCYDHLNASLGTVTQRNADGGYVCSNGAQNVDNDGNGYPHDISGWDFYNHQNDPATYDASYSHANSQQKQAAAQTNNGVEGAGVCAGCLLLPIKAGAEALDRSDDLAQAWLFAVDSGASIITSVTADLGYSTFMAQAVEYAWRHGVVMAESSNDFDSTDHQGGMWWPHVLPGNAVVANSNGLQGAAANAATSTYRARSDYTSWGTHAMFSVTTQGGTTSESTPTVTGVMGLVLGFGRYAADKGWISAPLTGPEAIQVVRQTASRIDDPTLPWPGSPGDWNLQYGYGRPNVDKAMKAVRAGAIPPVAWLDSPEWYSLYDPTQSRSISVTGDVADSRSTAGYHWQLQYGLGAQPQTWTTFASGSGSSPQHVSGQLDLTGIPASFWDDAQNPYRMSATKTLESTEQYTVSLRLQAVDNRSGLLGEERRSIAVHHDPALIAGFPLRLGHGGDSQPALADLQGTGRLAIVFGDSDGYIHAIDPQTRHELPGWPQHTQPVAVTKAHPGISPGYEPVLAPVAVGDLDHTGELSVVASSTRGREYVFDAAGHLRSGWPQTMAIGVAAPDVPRPPLDHTRLPQQGSIASPVLYDLSQGSGTDDHKLEIIQAAWDGHLHVWRSDGTSFPGWPVVVPRPDAQLDPGYRWVNDHKLDSTPVIAHLQGSAPDVVIRSQWTEITGSGLQPGGAGFLHAYDAHGQALNGWPVKMRSIVEYYGSAQEFITEGAEDEAAAPLLPGGADAVASGPVLSPTYLFSGSGQQIGTYGPLPGSASATFLQNAATCISAPASCPYSAAELQNFMAGNLPADAPVYFTTGGVFGRTAVPGPLSFAQPGTGSSSLASALLFSGSGFAIKNYITAFNGQTGAPLPGYGQQIQGLDFIGSPILADVTGNGQPEIVTGGDSSALMAFGAGGVIPSGFPKFTTGWALWAPSAGDLLSDGHTDLVQLTREGYLFAWRTNGSYAGNQEWWTGHHDEWRTGLYGADTRPPGVIRDARWNGPAHTLTFVAPGGDWYAGQVASYLLTLPGGQHLSVAAHASAGSRESVTVPAGVDSVIVQALDGAGNLGRATTVRLG